MRREMSHEEARALFAGEALDALSGEERDAALAHAAGCATCRREMADLRDTAGALAYAAPASPLTPERSSALRARLVARAAADRGAGPGIRSAPPRPYAGAEEVRLAPTPGEAVAPRPRPLALREWLAAAAFLLALGLGAWAVSERRRADELSTRLAAAVSERARLRTELAARTDSLAARDELLAGLTGAGVQVVQLAAAGARAPSARMFWDQPTGRWTLIAHNLPATRAGRTYQLWLITPADQRISAGTFTPRPNGEALYRATYALPRDSLQAVAVTEEPEGGVPQPTGEIVIVGRAR